MNYNNNSNQNNQQSNPDQNLLAIKNHFILFTDEDDEEEQEEEKKQQQQQQQQISPIPNNKINNINIKQQQQIQSQPLQNQQQTISPSLHTNQNLNTNQNSHQSLPQNNNVNINLNNNNSNQYIENHSNNELNISQELNHQSVNIISQNISSIDSISDLSNSNPNNQNNNNNAGFLDLFEDGNALDKQRLDIAKKSATRMKNMYIFLMFMKMFSVQFGILALIEFIKHDYHSSIILQNKKNEQLGIIIYLVFFDFIELLYYTNLWQYCRSLISNLNLNHPLFHDLLYSENIFMKHANVLRQQSCLVGKWMGRIIFIAELVIFWFITVTQMRTVSKNRSEWEFKDKTVIYFINYSLLYCDFLIFFVNALQIVFIIYILYHLFNCIITNVKNKYKFYKLEKYLSGELYPQFLQKYQQSIMTQNQNISLPQQCSICMEEYQNNEYIVNLKCQGNHHFHSECVKPWIKQNMTCPNCRDHITENNFS